MQKIQEVADFIGKYLKKLGLDIPSISGVTHMGNHKPEGGHVRGPQPLHWDGTLSLIIPFLTNLKLLVAPGSHGYVLAVSMHAFSPCFGN